MTPGGVRRGHRPPGEGSPTTRCSSASGWDTGPGGRGVADRRRTVIVGSASCDASSRAPGRRAWAPSWASCGPHSTPETPFYHHRGSRDLADPIRRIGRRLRKCLTRGGPLPSGASEARNPDSHWPFRRSKPTNKTELVDAIATKTGDQRADAAKVPDGFFEVVPGGRRQGRREDHPASAFSGHRAGPTGPPGEAATWATGETIQIPPATA